MDSLLHATMRRTTSLAAASAMLTMYGPDDKKPDDDTKAIVDAERWEKMLAASTEELRAAASALPQQEVLRLCDENTEGATAPSSSADVDESTVIAPAHTRALCMRSACLGKLARYAEAARAATASLRAVQLGVPADDARGCMLAKRAQHNVNLSLHKFALAEEGKTKTTSARAEAGMKRVRSVGQQMQDSSAARARAAVAH